MLLCDDPIRKKWGAASAEPTLTQRSIILHQSISRHPINPVGVQGALARHAGKAARYRHSRRFASNLLKLWPALWTFTDHEGVQPTNNHAERCLRGAVIARKLSLGSQSPGGERRTQRLLSAHTTCRLQRRSLHTYLCDLLDAHARGHPVPLLS